MAMAVGDPAGHEVADRGDQFGADALVLRGAGEVEIRGRLHGEVGDHPGGVVAGVEADGIVHRESYDVVPPKVEYSLTELGDELNTALGPLGAWGKRRMAVLEEAGPG